MISCYSISTFSLQIKTKPTRIFEASRRLWQERKMLIDFESLDLRLSWTPEGPTALAER